MTYHNSGTKSLETKIDEIGSNTPEMTTIGLKKLHKFDNTVSYRFRYRTRI